MGRLGPSDIHIPSTRRGGVSVRVPPSFPARSTDLRCAVASMTVVTAPFTNRREPHRLWNLPNVHSRPTTPALGSIEGRSSSRVQFVDMFRPCCKAVIAALHAGVSHPRLL